MNELCLFAGGGGGSIASFHFHKWKTVCYVEWDSYCQKILQARIKDGLLSDAPIWGDIKTFDGKPWCGCVDIITAGFPCQPFSVAGKQKGINDDRNGWPDTIRIIREVQPQYCLLENVTGLLANEYIRTIFAELAESGYNARWEVLSAKDCGAIHRRERVWILATNNIGKRNEGGREEQVQKFSGFSWCKNVRGLKDLRNRPDIPQPLIRGKSNGIPNWMDRLRALGNGQVPQCAFMAWEILTGKLDERDRKRLEG